MYNVLLVDDEPPLLELAKAFLEITSEIRVVPALSARKALKSSKQTPSMQ